MPESIWLEGDPLDELHLPDWILTSTQRRRLKAALVLIGVWGLVTLMHLLPITRWISYILAILFWIHAIRVISARPAPLPPKLDLPNDRSTPLETPSVDPAAETPSDPIFLPKVSILIPAKNEEKVLPRLLATLAELDYPQSHTELWVIDDGSTDGSAAILAEHQTRLPHLHVHNRQPGSSGGKSGALNEVLPLTQGEIILVCDADAQVPPDLLRLTLPLFASPEPKDAGDPKDLKDPKARPIGAVQVRKAIANADFNVWTRGQRVEMAFDSYFQQQRIAVEGIGELRGNGQFVRRDVLEKCGGWNEETLTDDLDLTIKLHLAGVDIAFVTHPAVEEEGVTRWINLWNQRSRWAEGGYQRYLDYWPGILSNRLHTLKTFDLIAFFISQYLFPVALIPDLLWILMTGDRSVLLPLGTVVGATSVFGFVCGLGQVHDRRGWRLIREATLGFVYMLHWFPVMIVTTARMCVQPKRLKWIKTEHQGTAPG